MVVVMQLFTGNQDAPGADIGAGVRRLKVAVTPVVAGAIDDAGRHDRCPGHLQRPDRQTGSTKQRQVDDQHQAHALPGEARVEIAFDPVLGRAVAIAGHGFQVLGLGPVQLGALQQHGLDTVHMRTVRVIRLLALGVVLAVDGGPFLGHLAGAQPQPETEKMRCNQMQIQCPVCLMPMQKHGDADHGDMGHSQGSQHNLPPLPSQSTMRQPFDCCIQHSTFS